MSRSLQDQFIDDDEEEACPLCVEEFDLTDKGFRPCPCGYQICQFCYNNVKNNMNGLCPACRRPYRDEDIEYKTVTSEEAAAHRARQAQKQKKTQAALQKEKQKAEADHLSRKHLAGMRVVQKNLVYVTGLSPTVQEDQLLQTLRGDQYFGQYGKIIKIVVSKAKDHNHPHSVGVYVTYERKEDAQKCINAVDGVKNGERTLRAQFGTTKYCSAYLRGETCSNRNCMFLHEPGEANESYSRADLSALNAGSSQHGGQGRAPPPQSQQPMASAAQPMDRQGSEDQHSSPPPDRPALPSTASWASKPPQARTESRAASAVVESPAPVMSTPAPIQAEPEPQPEPELQPELASLAVPYVEVPEQPRKSPVAPILALLSKFRLEDLMMPLEPSCLSQADLDIIKHYPPLFDTKGHARLRLRREREEEQRRMEQEAQTFQQPPAIDQDENPEMSGSLQLGGEPEERPSVGQIQSVIHPPAQDGGLDQRFQFGGGVSSPGISDRGMTPQQHQQMLLQALKPNTPGTFNQPANFQSSFQQPNSNQPLGHQRNASRYSFANDSSSASTTVKVVANPKLMNQQSSMMPQAGGNHFNGQQQQQQQHQQNHGQFYTSNVQGPPPGLKTTGTPPVSGNLTFGQGHGFAMGGLQYGAGASRNQQDTYYRELLRGREGGAGSSVDAKHDADFPPLAPTRQHSITSRVSLEESRRSTPPVPPGFEGQLANESRRSTPTVPPGLAKLPTALPDLEGASSRPSSRASLRRTASQIMPALPLRPGTPARVVTPTRKSTKHEHEAVVLDETPTKPSRSRTTTASDLRKALSVQQDEAKSAGAEVSENAEVATSLTKSTASKDEDSKAAVTTAPSSPSTVKPTPSAAETTPETSTKENMSASQPDPVTPSKPEPPKSQSLKRKHPGKLDITAAVHKQNQETASANATPVDTDTSGRLPLHQSMQTPSSSSKPPISESPSVASPSVKPAPRTLRVVPTPTPKTETPSTTFPPALPPASAIAYRLPSRQPSVASINPPGTPSSEQVSMSDNISLTSTSLSRANSPPPPSSKVGSAPVRAKTKNQMKKERQDRAKAMEEEKIKAEVTVKTPAEGPAQEAIVSRKKKAKKEKEPKLPKAKATTTTAETTPTASRPVSPGKAAAVELSAKPAVPASIPREPEPATPTKTVPIASQPSMPTTAEPSPPPTPTLTAAQLIAELKASAPEIQKCIDSLFRVSNSHHFKTPSNVSPKDLLSGFKSDFNVKLTKDEVDALLSGKVPAVHRGGDSGQSFDRHMITPSGAHLRALTKELESRFLELEKALREMPDEFKFRPPKPQNDMKLPSFDLEEVKRKYDNGGGRGTNVMEQMVQDGNGMRKGAFLVDEASKYINEFVMPPVTPPPSAAGQARGQGGAHHQSGSQQNQGGAGEGPSVPSVEIAERQLNEAKRQADERENALRKVIKKNKKLFGVVN